MLERGEKEGGGRDDAEGREKGVGGERASFFP